MKVGDEVGLRYYRMERVFSGAIDLKEGEDEGVKSPTEVGTGKPKEEEAPFEATMHYFDFDCSDERRAQRLYLFPNRFVIIKNDRAADWDEAMILQANVDYVDSLSRYDLECYARKFNVSLETYVSRVKNNNKSFVKECHESLERA